MRVAFQKAFIVRHIQYSAGIYLTHIFNESRQIIDWDATELPGIEILAQSGNLLFGHKGIYAIIGHELPHDTVALSLHLVVGLVNHEIVRGNELRIMPGLVELIDIAKLALSGQKINQRHDRHQEGAGHGQETPAGEGLPNGFGFHVLDYWCSTNDWAGAALSMPPAIGEERHFGRNKRMSCGGCPTQGRRQPLSVSRPTARASSSVFQRRAMPHRG